MKHMIKSKAYNSMPWWGIGGASEKHNKADGPSEVSSNTGSSQRIGALRMLLCIRSNYVCIVPHPTAYQQKQEEG